jgi:hypothetical protein
MLELRIDDQPFLNLIRKWLKAGILDTDGKVLHPATGTPQGGQFRHIANVYLPLRWMCGLKKLLKSIVKAEYTTVDTQMILSVHFKSQAMRNAFIKCCRKDWQHWIGSGG